MSRIRAILTAFSPALLALICARCIGSEPALIPYDGGNGDGASRPTKDGGDSGRGHDAGDATTRGDAKSDVAAHDGGRSDAGSDARSDAGHDARIDTGVDAGTDATGICNTLVAADDAAPGSFDPTFDGVIEPATVGSPTRLIQDSQGRIYLLGSKQNCVSASSDADFTITRLNPDGTVDKGYGLADGGIAPGEADAGLSVSSGTVCVDFVGGADLPAAFALDSSGNLVVVGMATLAAPFVGASTASYFYTARVALVRLTPEGLIDTSFNGTGKNRIITGPAEAQQAVGIAIDSHDDIFAVGTTQALPVPVVGSATANYGAFAAFIVKVGSSGSLSPQWGMSGFEVDDALTGLNGATVSGSSLFVVGTDFGVAIDGGVAGGLYNRHFVARKYVTTTPGGLDTTFGPNVDGGTPGETLAAPGQNDYGQSIALDTKGNVLVAGIASVGTPAIGGAGFSAGAYGPGYAAVVRYTPNGALDPTFGTGGMYISPDLKGFPAYEPNMLAVQCNGAVLLGALICPQAYITYTSYASSSQSLAVLRLTPGGVADPTYGGGGPGVGIADLVLGYDSNVNSMLIDPAQRALVLSGVNTGGTGPVLTRFLP